MKLLVLFFTLLSTVLIGQINPRMYEGTEQTVIMIGYGNGGGSILGADIETLVSPHIGVQAGAGFLGFNAGVNYHFKPKIHAPYISLQYWYNGISNAYAYQSIGPFIGLRFLKFVNLTAGYSYLLDTGPNAINKIEDSKFVFSYTVGVYFPF